MKDSDLQELKPVYIYKVNESEEEEISLVDLIKVLVRRWKMMATIVILLTSLVAVYSITKPNQYTYRTVLEVGSIMVDETIRPFPTAQSLSAKIEHSLLPNMLRERNSESSTTERIKIKASSPKKSNIIVLSTKGTEKQSASILETLEHLSRAVIQDHKPAFDAVEKNLSRSRDVLASELGILDSQDKPQPEQMIYIKNKIEKYDAMLAGLNNIRVLSPPSMSHESKNKRGLLIVIATAFASVFLAIVTALFVEFIAKVREQL